MSQSEFGDLIGKQQTIVSRLENPNYSGWTLSTLFEIASKLNIAVFVRFVDFGTFLKYSGDQSVEAMRPREYDEHAMDDFLAAETAADASWPIIFPSLGNRAPTLANNSLVCHGAVISPSFLYSISPLILNQSANSKIVVEGGEVRKLKQDLVAIKEQLSAANNKNAWLVERVKQLEMLLVNNTVFANNQTATSPSFPMEEMSILPAAQYLRGRAI